MNEANNESGSLKKICFHTKKNRDLKKWKVILKRIKHEID